MTTTTTDWRDSLEPQDFAHSYDLPATVDATIPNRAQPGEPAAHWVARGLLAETSARLGGQPLSLDYIPQPHTTFIAAHLTLPSAEPVEPMFTVELVLSGGRWTLLLDDCTIGTGAYLPSPRWLADRIETAYNEDDYR